MLLEAKGSWEEAEKAYSSFLEDSPLDQVSSEQTLPGWVDVICKDGLFCCVIFLFYLTFDLFSYAGNT